MAERMLKFTVTPRKTPEKREADTRAGDFHEIYRDFIDAKASEQASRCSQCGVPFCQTHCPLHNNIPDWLRMTAEGRLEEAYALSQATNAMPEICGRICPQDRLCEGNCVIEQSGHGTVTIGAVERYLSDKAWEMGWVRPVAAGVDRKQSVGIIGAGPAGLAAAERLRELGYAVTVYDRHDRPGGLLVYGIPGFKLEKDVVERRTRRLAEGGVEYVLDFEVGRDASLDQLRAKHDSILIATGVYAARDMTVPGAGSAGVVAALDYLIASNRKGMGDQVADFDSGKLNATGKDVVVVGGGDTAMDCVRTAVRQGATSVTCLYRRDRANMPGSDREVANAEEEGVIFEWLAAPKAVTGDALKAAGLMAARMRLGPPDSSGRQAPEEIEGADFELRADLVIKALGFDPEDIPTVFGTPDLAVTRWGTVKADMRNMMTSIPGVFAAGDIVRGASLVVWAIRDGRDSAEAIHRYLMAHASADTLIAAE
ncbi:MAG: NAD(P)-dependent oxidoreductase [Alphaproteobacteria bacterium]|nr:NAD(P)-dependent oxidoreductase [Alphaproteobacteria bacterium]MBU1517066.1 NAD(P)-dependent oxidoreductase [Alphaproteobacteria bacterium]MBU2093685.1 NAD(P)-dependent oxidoreductase [Alphaproteobacteria bacterium]MBU2153993.1 NAD(P)-dependent oxidoreductase [Alphaproteobacteria bacterium]MBU2308715.1 NAD(P)-dependent oxidoreductase [Alphaproteobacteria bacterium]